MSEDHEQRIRIIEIELAKKDVVIQNMLKVVEENTQAITALTAVLNRGKGAAWAMAGAYTLFGGIVGLIVEFFLRK